LTSGQKGAAAASAFLDVSHNASERTAPSAGASSRRRGARTRITVNIGLSIALALVLLLPIGAYVSHQQLRRATALRIHTYEVIQEIDALRGALQDIERAARGYVITGRQDFLTPYQHSLPEADAARKRIGAITIDNPRQQKHLLELAGVTSRWLEYVGSLTTSNPEAAAAKVAAGEGKAMMEHVQKVLREMKEEEETLLAVRDREFQTIAKQARMITVGGSLGAFILVAAAAIILNRQLSQRSRWLQEREHYAASLEAVNQELEAFSYSVSHDLRAPLRHIDGFVGLLLKRTQGTLDDKSQRYLATIAGAAKQMGQLVDDLLSFSRMSRDELKVARVDMQTLVEEIRHELETQKDGQREVAWRIAELPPAVGDRAMLRVALTNLLANALKYTRPRSPAEITVAAEKDHELVRYTVRDNGVGFDMKYVSKLFGVFQRLHRSEDFEGTGIGLANVKRIVHRHGGEVWAESVVGEGAAFHFTLKAASH
jgi:signal transduction histidine kinase